MILTLLAAGAAALFGLSGSASLEDSRRRFDAAAQDYNNLLPQAEVANQNLEDAMTSFGSELMEAFRIIRRANRVLSPLSREHGPQLRMREQATLTTVSRAGLVC